MAQSVQKKLSPYKNENLFSRHYLKKVIQRTSIWEVDEDEVEQAFDELESIYEDEKAFLPNREDDEEELRNDFITPILRRVLDFNKEQEKKSGGSQRIPDYALYDTAEKKKQALDSGDYYKHAIGLVEAKAWKKDLEKKTSTGDPSTDGSNPTKQIVDYLIENKPQWGVLTNGKKWRLVHREASNRLDTYYEVDIENLLTSERPREERLEEFKYFYIFFRKQAFQGDEGDKILDEILEESLQYAEEIGEDLEENIYHALEWLAKGYIENSSNEGIEDVPIQEIHDNSLIYLYRLLFALNADSRGILGDPGGKYEYYNFSELVDEVCEEIDEGDGYGKTGLISNRLNAIFRMIDEGSQSQDIPKDELHIPAYNGGLFNQDKHEFLQKYNLHDKYLAKVIDLVARTEREEEGGKARVDYYDLSVRHLGGIYEGLLEYQLEKADEDMIEVKEDGDLQVKTIEEAEEDGNSFSDNDIIEEGQPYLVTDDGERKATGSYYTPDYIVKYIVENTVGPKVEEEIEDLETDEEKAEAILDMQILDPAMGSAHFLVEVIDYLATELVDHKEIEIDQAKREVARQCVYGVDVNPLATELGKLSIWLKTISEDKPLSFLDHHIKTGNSLIGADIHDINRHPEEDKDSDRQVTIGEEFGEENAGVVRANVQEMLKKFKEIQEKQADSPEDIKEQEELYQEFLDFPFRKRFDVLADVYTSHYFDNDYKVDDYNRLLQAFKLQEQKEEGDEEWNQVIQEDWVQKATDSLDNSHEEDNTSSQKGFFHWKLEFPEVFFDIEEGVEKQDSGFDAVVGNPPYVKRQNLPDQKEAEYYEQVYTSTTYNYDLYLAFTERGFNLIDSKGEFGYILPSKFTTTETGNGLREFIDKKAKIREYVDFETYQVFEGVTTYTCLLFLNNTASKVLYKRVDKDRPEKIYEYSERSTEIEQSLSGIGWDLKPSVIDYRSIEEKLKDKGDIFTGIETGADKIFILEQDDDFHDTAKKYEGEIVHKALKGGDVDPYFSRSSKLVIVPYDEHENLIEWSNLEENYPEIANYLKRNEDKLRSREDGKMDNDRWYGYVYPKNLNKFDEKRIIWPDIAIEPEFSLDKDYWHVRTVASFSPMDSGSDNTEGLVPILNSKVFLRYMIKNTNKVRGGYLRFRPQYIREFPVVETNDKLEKLSRERHSNQSEIEKINLNIRDYLTTSLDDLDGKTLGEMYMPVEGLSDSILRDTKEDRDNIKIGSVEFEENGSSLILNVSVKYKPEDDEGFDDEELDRWGYVETDLMPAMNFTVGDKMKALIKEFVPVAVDEAGGFANFREKATKTNSVVDRLEDLTLPKLDDVEQGLEKFIENKEEAEALEEEIQETDELIDAIVFDLYGLTEQEVETVLESLDTSEGEKASILERFEEVQS